MVNNTTLYPDNNYLIALIELITTAEEPIRLKQIEGTGEEPDYFVVDNGECISTFNGKYLYLKQEYNNSGYKSIKIRGKRYLIHREVAKAFVYNPHPEERVIVHHLDEDKDNNNYTNLRFIDKYTHKIYHNCKRKYKDDEVELQDL